MPSARPHEAFPFKGYGECAYDLRSCIEVSEVKRQDRQTASVLQQRRIQPVYNLRTSPEISALNHNPTRKRGIGALQRNPSLTFRVVIFSRSRNRMLFRDCSLVDETRIFLLG